MKRALTPATNPAGIGSSAAAVYAAIVMIVNATSHHAVIDPQVVIAALGAAAFLYARFKVTPVADPKDGNGQPLVAAAASPVITVNTTATQPANIGQQVAAAMRTYESRRPGGMFVDPAQTPVAFTEPSMQPGQSDAPESPPEKTLIPPAAAAAEQPPAAAGPAEPAVPE